MKMCVSAYKKLLEFSFMSEHEVIGVFKELVEIYPDKIEPITARIFNM